MENDANVVFVNTLEVSGFVNGVVNLAFATLRFVPQYRDPGEGNPPQLHVATDPVISANLRMDLLLAQQLHARLGEIIDEHIKPKVTN